MSDKSQDSENLRGVPGIALRAPGLILAFVIVLTALLGLNVRWLAVDGSPARLLPDIEPRRDFSAQVAHEFRDAETITVRVSADDVFAPESLATIDELSNRLWHLDGVSRVVGPTTLNELVMRDGVLQMVPLLSALPDSAEEAESVRRAVLAHPMAAQGIVSRDAKVATLTVLLAPEDATAQHAAVVARINDVVAELSGAGGAIVSGRPVLAVESARVMASDSMTLTALATLVTVLVAWLALRSLRGTLIALLSVSVGWLWTFGLMALSGHDITLGNLSLLPLLLVIGIAYPLTILARYDQELTEERSPRQSLVACLRQARLPLAATATATAIGIGVQLPSAFPVIRDFAFNGVVGVACMYVVSLLVVPAAVMLLPPSARPQRGEASPHSSMLETLGAQTVRFRAFMVVLGGIVLVSSLWGISSVRVDTHYVRLAGSSPITPGTAPAAAQLAPPDTIEVVIDARQPDSIRRPAILQALRDLREFIEHEPGVTATWSLLDYMQMAAKRTGTKGEPLRLMDQGEVDRLLSFDPEYAFEVVNKKLSKTRLIVHTRELELPEVETLIRRIQGFASPKLLSRSFGKRSLFPRGTRVRLAGDLVRASHATEQLRADQWKALWRAAMILLVAVSLLFLSLRVGVIALLLNAASVLLLFALMGWLGAELNVVTASLATLVFGLSVGHTTHYLDASAGGSNRSNGSRAVAAVVRTVGRPIGFAALALAGGLFVLVASSFPALRWFGALGCLTIGIAFIANLFVLATRVLTLRLVTIPDVLLIRVGNLEDIPLFEGLRPFQAKIVVLTGRLASAEPGELITRKGEVKSELYVLLNGAADVRDSSRGTSIGTLGRGDVIGEMGLVRDLPRSADVLATETTEYLVLDGTFLNRLRRQYPRIAATVFLNLTKILSDRLERTTRRLVEMG
jgi:predicted RND superfamily exporter protein